MAESKQFLGNAKKLLKENAEEEEGYYQNIKYVKMAGKSAFSDVLLELDLLLDIGDKKKKDFDWYKDQLHHIDEMLMNRFVSVYYTLYFSMGFDGNPSSAISKIGLDEAELMIDLLKNYLLDFSSKIEKSRKQLDSGKLYSHEEVKESYKKWLE